MDLSVALENLMKDLGLTQVELGEKVFADQAQVSKWLSGKRTPSPLPCLYLAAIAKKAVDKALWLNQSGLSDAEFLLLAAALRMPGEALGKDSDWHRMLDEILRDPDERIGIEKNLKWAVESIRKKPRSRKRG